MTERLGANPDYQRGWVDGARWQRQRLAMLYADAQSSPTARKRLEWLLAEEHIEDEVTRA